jgi:Tol biopolymer transport system component
MRRPISALTALVCVAATLVGTAATADPAPRKARPTLTAKPAHALQGTTVVLSAKLPTRFKRPTALQRKAGKHWRTVAKRKSRATGTVRYSVQARADTTYRVTAKATRHHGTKVKAVVSRTRRVSPTLRAELVSATPSGRASSGESGFTGISGTGRYVVFHSSSHDLLPGLDALPDGRINVFLRDRQTGTTTLVSATTAGAAGNGDSVRPVVSRDGRYVAYVSYADDLVADDTNDHQDVFRWDRVTDTTVLVSHDFVHGPSNADSYDPSISGDGARVGFSTDATDIAFNDDNGASDVFVWNAATENNALLSVADPSGVANAGSFSALVSADGTHAAFMSSATDIVAGDTNGFRDAFLRDLTTGDTILVSVPQAGGLANSYSGLGAISRTGRYVGFGSGADNMATTTKDDNAFANAYVRDTVAGTTTWVSPDRTGNAPNQHVYAPSSIADDGGTVAFTAVATDLVAEPTSGEGAVYLWRKADPHPRLLVRDRTWGLPNGPSYEPQLSADLRFVSFYSAASDLVPGDGNDDIDVFVWRR